MLYVFGEKRDFDVDFFKKSVLELDKDAQTEQGRHLDERGAIQVPHEGSPVGEAARAPGADWGPEGGPDALLDEKPTRETEEN